MQSALIRRAIETHGEATERVGRIVEGLSDTQANWRSGPKSWSVAECIAHLNRSLDTYMARMTPAIEAARVENQTGTEPYGRGTLVGRFLVGFLSNPSKKTSAPGVFQPEAGELDSAATAQTFRELASRFQELAEAADGLDLDSIKIATPVSGWLRLSLAQAFEVHILHTPRHLAQAERVTQHPEFPSR